jgi:hypothetical protein
MLNSDLTSEKSGVQTGFAIMFESGCTLKNSKSNKIMAETPVRKSAG